MTNETPNETPEELLTREELIAMIQAMRERQATHGGQTLSVVAAMQAQRADEAERKNRLISEKNNQLTDALHAAMALISQLVTENGRLCSASKEPPPIGIFAAHKAFTENMQKVLGD